MLRLWGRLSSINMRKVVLTARLLEVPFEHVETGPAFTTTRTPDYIAFNPNSLVPTLEEDGFFLWESNVIVRYLCATHAAGTLYPVPLRERFDAERWMDWQQTTFNPAGRDAFLQLIRTPEAARNTGAIEASIRLTEPLLDILDVQLAQRPFLAGDHLTMADIPLACELHRWWGLPLEHRPRPHVRRWFDDLLARPASRGVLDLPLS